MTLSERLLTVSGAICLFIGIAWGFVDAATHFRFRFFSDLEEVSVLAVLTGILLSSISILLVLRGKTRGAKAKVSGLLFAIGLLAYSVSGTRGWLHGPGALLFPVALASWMLGIILIAMAAVYRGERQQDRSSK
jgi:hypothetical protein